MIQSISFYTTIVMHVLVGFTDSRFIGSFLYILFFPFNEPILEPFPYLLTYEDKQNKNKHVFMEIN